MRNVIVSALLVAGFISIHATRIEQSFIRDFDPISIISMNVQSQKDTNLITQMQIVFDELSTSVVKKKQKNPLV